MSHIHIPDGIFPWWLIIAGWAVTLGWTAVAVRVASKQDLRRRVPLIGAMAAMMLVGMSSEIVPIAYHLNLTVLSGILLGPWLSVITALVVNLMLGLLGHGGVTVIGLNAMLIAVEMVVGWALFRALIRMLGQRRGGVASAGATVLALMLSSTMLIGIVAAGGPSTATRDSGALDPASLTFSNPFADGIASSSLLAGDAHDHDDDHGHDHGTEDEHADEVAPGLDIPRFATMVYFLGSIGWTIEALITALIVGFLARVRPGLVFEGASAQHARPPVGDEGVHH